MVILKGFHCIDDLMCNSFKIKDLLHKIPPLDRAASKDGIFAKHICMLIQPSVYDYLSYK